MKRCSRTFLSSSLWEMVMLFSHFLSPMLPLLPYPLFFSSLSPSLPPSCKHSGQIALNTGKRKKTSQEMVTLPLLLLSRFAALFVRSWGEPAEPVKQRLALRSWFTHSKRASEREANSHDWIRDEQTWRESVRLQEEESLFSTRETSPSPRLDWESGFIIITITTGSPSLQLALNLPCMLLSLSLFSLYILVTFSLKRRKNDTSRVTE